MLASLGAILGKCPARVAASPVPRDDIFLKLSSLSKRMKALVVSLRVKPEKRQAFLSAAEDDSTCSVRDEPGCVRFDVLEDGNDPNHFFFYEIYKDDAAIDAHRTMAHYARWEKARNECVDNVNVTQSEVLFPAEYR
jgi:(4S)-4-hydroxy-5-phosphonooxypentane-2,3-dione isomerase